MGAAVSDHLENRGDRAHLAERGLGVGLSSLRPDRLKDEFVGALALRGLQDAHAPRSTARASACAISIERRGREPHYVNAAEHARKHGMERLKLYLMIGLPGETDADIDECVKFVSDLSRTIPVALGVAPSAPKRKTPLDRMPYAGVRTVEQRLERLRRGLRGRGEVRAVSARWAWVEYVLAQAARARAWPCTRRSQQGGRFADYKRAFTALGHSPDGEGYAGLSMPIAPERAKLKRLNLVAPG